MEGRYEERWVLVEDDGPPPMAEHGRAARSSASPHRGVTGPKRVSGAARFVSDISLPGMLHAAVLRCPHAHATVELDLDAAAAMPGVHAVLDARRRPDLDGAAGADRRARVRGRRRSPRSPPRRPRPPQAALDGAAPAVDDAAVRGRPRGGAARPALHRGSVRGRRAATSTPPSAEADVVIEAEYRTPAQLQHALEPHCAVAAWEAGRAHDVDRRRRASSPPAASWRSLRARCPTRARELRVHGRRLRREAGRDAEGFLAAHLARRSRPARAAVSTTAAPRAWPPATGAATVQTYRIGARRDGTLVGDRELGRDRHRRHTAGSFPVLVPGRDPVPLRERAHSMVLPVKLNLGFSNAFRAPGVMEGTFGFEQAIDELAEVLGIDPLELRRRNGVDVDQASGQPVHLEAPRAMPCERAAELAGWAERDELRDRHPDGRQRGLGVASQIWWGGGGPPAHATVPLGADGVATLVTGVQDIGTGVSTTLAPGRRPRSSACRSTGCASRPAPPATASTLRSPAARRRRPRWRRRCGPRPTTCGCSCWPWPATCSRSRRTTSSCATARSVRATARCASRSPRSPASSATPSSSAPARAARTPRARDPHVRLPDRAGRGRRGDRRDRGRADHRGARHRPRDQPARRVEPGRGRRSCRRSASRSPRSAWSTRRPAPWSTRASRTTSCRRWPTRPRSWSSSWTIPTRTSPMGVKGLGEPPIVPTAAAVANAVAAATGLAAARGAADPPPRPRGPEVPA